MVDRYTDTWGRAEFKPPYSEQKGAIAIKMRQRNFQRGKSVLMQVEGKMRKLQLQLVQQRRLRIPGLSKQVAEFRNYRISALARFLGKLLP